MTLASSLRLLSLASVAAVFVAASASPARADDPTMSDCLVANETAGKLQTDKKLRKAREQAAICAAETCPAELHTACRQRVADLNHAIPTIVFQVKDASGADLSAVKVSMDGQPLLDRLEGTAISVDPGPHTFRFETAGQPAVDRRLVLVEGQKDRIESVTFGAGAADAVAPVVAPGAQAASSQPATPGADTASGGGGWSTGKYVALGVAGVGLVGIVVGSVEAASASSSWNSSKSECPATGCSQHAQAVTDHDNAVTAATVSTVSFVAGGVLLVGGAAWFLLAPNRGGGNAEGSRGVSLQVTPSVGPGGGGFLMRGSF